MKSKKKYCFQCSVSVTPTTEPQNKTGHGVSEPPKHRQNGTHIFRFHDQTAADHFSRCIKTQICHACRTHSQTGRHFPTPPTVVQLLDQAPPEDDCAHLVIQSRLLLSFPVAPHPLSLPSLRAGAVSPHCWGELIPRAQSPTHSHRDTQRQRRRKGAHAVVNTHLQLKYKWFVFFCVESAHKPKQTAPATAAVAHAAVCFSSSPSKITTSNGFKLAVPRPHPLLHGLQRPRSWRALPRLLGTVAPDRRAEHPARCGTRCIPTARPM